MKRKVRYTKIVEIEFGNLFTWILKELKAYQDESIRLK